MAAEPPRLRAPAEGRRAGGGAGGRVPREAGDCSGFERVLGVFDYATGVFGSVIGVFDCVCVTCFCTSRAATLKLEMDSQGPRGR